jgi:acyl carrier protein
VGLSKKIKAEVAWAVQKLKRKIEDKQKSIDSVLKLKGRSDHEYSEVESKLARIYCQVLGFNEIDIYDNFFEMGGDSVMLSNVHMLLESEYSGKVKLLDLFEYTSIHKLCQFITGQNSSDGEESIIGIEEETRNMLEQFEKGSLRIEEFVGETDEENPMTREDYESNSIRSETLRLFEELEKGNISIENAIINIKKGSFDDVVQGDSENEVDDED